MSDPDPALAAPPAGGNGRQPRRLLVASILLNVFLIGVIAAGATARHGPFFHGGHDRPLRPFEMPSPRKIRAALPDSARPVAEAMFAAHRDEVRLKIRAMIEARRAVAAAIGAEPFDRTALDAALATLRSREADLASTVQTIIADLAEGVDAQSRSRIAALLEVRRGPDEPR